MRDSYRVLSLITMGTLAFVLVGCNTKPPPQKGRSVLVVQNQVRGNVMVLAVHPAAHHNVRPPRNAIRLLSEGPLQSVNGMIKASTMGRTRGPLEITLVSHGKERYLYEDRSTTLKQLLGWQVNGGYLLLNVGSPDPDVAVADYPGQAVVIDLTTDKVAATELIQEESQITALFLTPTDLVQQWFYIFGSTNSSDQYVTKLVNLKTDSGVTMQSQSFFPLGTDLTANGTTVVFAGKGGTYTVDIPDSTWTRSVTSKWYRVVLKPGVSVSQP